MLKRLTAKNHESRQANGGKTHAAEPVTGANEHVYVQTQTCRQSTCTGANHS